MGRPPSGMRVMILSLVGVIGAAAPHAAFAQQPSGVLHVTVVDATGAVIVGATVTVTGIEGATQGVAPAAI